MSGPQEIILAEPRGFCAGVDRAIEIGERNPELMQRVKRSLLAELGDPDQQYQVGDVVQFPTPDGQGAYAGVVREVAEGGEVLVFDFNHPLAGRPVTFEVQLIGVL